MALLNRTQNAIQRHEKSISVVVLCLLTFIIWSWAHNLTSFLAWNTPLGWGGDSWSVLAIAKAFMDGDIIPIQYKWVSHLNAPFSANWNDFPITEEFIFATIGWLGKVIGLYPAANIMLLVAHLLAGLSFLYVGKILKYRTAFVMAGALLFAFSHYIFARGLPHISLSYYWHVPLMLLVTWQIYSSHEIQTKSHQWWMAIITAVIAGAFNPYYMGMFMQFLGFAILLHIVRKQYNLVLFPILLIAIMSITFLILNADTLLYAWFQGANKEAVSRNLAALDVYALKIPGLVFPPSYHRWQFWANFGEVHYFTKTYIQGEAWSPYLGIVGLVGLVWIAGISGFRILQGKAQMVPMQAWQIQWILLFSLVGGINLLLGTFGIMAFRGTNRYSIFILALVLLFVVRQLSRGCPTRMTIPVALGLVAIGLWDQLPPKVTLADIQNTANVVRSDRNFIQQVELNVPKGAMVFQLPVMAYPESPAIIEMGDYEHFRPYFYSKNLHYSYGTIKGRKGADWQNEISKLKPIEMVEKLESYGFSVIILNKKGYKDKAISLLNEIVSENRQIVADSPEMIAIRINPITNPLYPNNPVNGGGLINNNGEALK